MPEADIEHRQAELDKIKQRVAEMEAHLEKRAAAKDEIIDLRVQVLVNQAEGLGWSDEPGAGENRMGVFGGGLGRRRGIDAGGLERSLMGRGLERSLMRGGFGSRRGSGFIPPNESEDEQSHPEPVPEETSPE